MLQFGLAIAPGGRYLLATDGSGLAVHAASALLAGRPALVGVFPDSGVGAIGGVVVSRHPASNQDRRKLQSDPGRGLANGKVLWITARASNSLIALDAARVLGDPAHALIASVRVGPEPVGLALVDKGRLALVANSARFMSPHSLQSITVVDTSLALAGKPPSSARYPQENSSGDQRPPWDEVVATNYNSLTLETVSVRALRRAIG